MAPPIWLAISSTPAHARALRWRKPARDDDGCVRKCAGLAGAEAESGDAGAGSSSTPPGQRSERRPPQHDPRQHAARADAIAQRAGGNLEQAIGQREHRRHPSPSDRIDAEILLHTRTRDGDTDPVDVSDGEEQDEEPRYAVAISHGWAWGPMCHKGRQSIPLAGSIEDVASGLGRNREGLKVTATIAPECGHRHRLPPV